MNDSAPAPDLSGVCEKQFTAVQTAFVDNFCQHGEVGAALSIFQHGNPIVDIQAGTRDRNNELPWDANTLVNVFSAGKGVLALCAMQLEAKGKLDFGTPVADYWPEFAGQGKAELSVAEVLCHRSGLAAIWQDIAPETVFDWDAMVALLAQETPHFAPGTAQAYQVMTYGWLMGELIQRVSGLAVSDYIATHISGPLGLDLHFGVAKQDLPRVADVGPLLLPAGASNAKDSANPAPTAASDPLTERAFTYPESCFKGTNSRAWRQAVIPAANAHSDAKALATIYAGLALKGEINGVELLPADKLSHCYQTHSYAEDIVLEMPMRFGPGFMLHAAPGFNYGGRNTFGHSGNGGTLAFADPDSGIGFAYVTNRLTQADKRRKTLVNALYACL